MNNRERNYYQEEIGRLKKENKNLLKRFKIYKEINNASIIFSMAIGANMIFFWSSWYNTIGIILFVLGFAGMICITMSNPLDFYRKLRRNNSKIKKIKNKLLNL